MATYYVGIREVHITTVKVEAPDETSKQELRRLAREKHEDLDTLDTEFSHVMDELTWTVDGPHNYT
jgi:hypothetical protein